MFVFLDIKAQVLHLSVYITDNLLSGPKPLPIESLADPDVKSKVGTFIHKQFGQSKRISQHDKKSMERWLSEQIQTERKQK